MVFVRRVPEAEYRAWGSGRRARYRIFCKQANIFVEGRDPIDAQGMSESELFFPGGDLDVQKVGSFPVGGCPG